MAPTLGPLEAQDVSSDITTADNRQILQMSSANRGNGDAQHDGATVPDEQQTERGRVSHANGNGDRATVTQQTEHGSVSQVNELNLQASEEQRRDVTAPYDTITAQPQQPVTAPEPPQASTAPERPQPVDNRSPYPSILSELVRVQQEQEAEVSKFYDEIRSTAAQVRTTALAQERMAAGHQASRAETFAQMQAVLAQFNQVQEAQRKSDEQAQKTLDEINQVQEAQRKSDERAQKSDEQAQKTLDEIKKMKEEMKTREEKLSKEIKKEIKKEAKKEKVKKEKAAGKPKKNWSLYNIHVMEERKRLKALGSEQDLFQVAARSWREMSEEDRMRLYGDILTLDKQRYEREMEGWWEERKVPADQRKPAAKPSPEDLAATADPQEFATDAPIETQSPPEESAPIAATVGQGEQIFVPNLPPIDIATNGTEATLNEVVFPPPTTTIVINRRQEVHGATVALDEERTGDSSRATYPEAVPFLGVERISQEEQPVHAEEVRQSNSVPEAASLPETDANHHRDNTEDAIGSAAARRLQESTASLASNGDGNTQELPSVSARRPRGKKRKNHSPYWFRNAPVYELEGYTDGTPLQAGFVWVEYDSGIAVQVKEVELGKKLPPRSSRRRLSHNLFSARDSTFHEAGGSSGNVPEPQTTSPPETIYVNVTHRHNQAAYGDNVDPVRNQTSASVNQETASKRPERDCRRRSNDASKVPFPVGYRFYHQVPSGNHHQGYRCVAEVKEVIGDSELTSVFDCLSLLAFCCPDLTSSQKSSQSITDDGDFTSPDSMRRCYYYDLNDGSKRGGGTPFVKTIEKKKVYEN